ncbi:hypothetical protein EG68_06151 [Paragonimus skrjabini miyazakii]|uniref:C2H2-type domain-containing protein n=1 Tax=Paragonimus skrjabini miyazakii TaxID=59628 RepID=A0A8S9YVE5_9TREM|nr:hypothetical protein EG68_06151 [Paragonimus skrjabini miyazakii]
MEAVFPTPSARNVSDNGIPCISSVLNTNNLSVRFPSTQFACSASLETVLPSDHMMNAHLTTHLSVHSGSLSTPTSTPHASNLMRFTSDLNLSSIKPPIDASPLGDDEDDDMRSLLAAAAAVAASVSPPSPQLRSSSSGLNTPPDTRVCRPLDDVVGSDEHVKSPLESSEHGLHTAGGVALLVSRLTSTAAAYANAEDTLSVRLPSPSSTNCNSPGVVIHKAKNATYTSPAGTPNPRSSQFFSLHSPLRTPSEHSLLPSRASPLSRESFTDVMSIPCSTTITTCNTFIPTALNSKLSPPSVPPAPQQQQDDHLMNFELVCTDLKLNAEVTRFTESHSQPSLVGISTPTSKPFSSTPPSCSHSELRAPFPTDFSAPVTPTEQQRSDSIIKSSGSTAVTERDPTVSSTSSCSLTGTWSADKLSFVDSVPSTITPKSIELGNVLPDSQTANIERAISHPITDQSDLFITTDSATVPLEVNPNSDTAELAFVLSKSSLPSSNITTHCEKVTNGAGCNSTVVTSFENITHELRDPPPVEVTYTSSKVSVSEVHEQPTVKLEDQITSSGNVVLTKSDSNHNLMTDDGLLKPKHLSGSWSLSTDEHSTSKRLDDTDLLGGTVQLASDLGFLTNGHSSSGLPDFELTKANLTPKNEETCMSDVNPIELDAIITSSEDDPSPKPEGEEHCRALVEELGGGEGVCDEAEYVSAAVSAVEDVVYALAGNRKPDPSLTVDPALQGTGTDRIFTLSLAPIHPDLSSSSLSTNCASSLNQLSMSLINAIYTSQVTESFHPSVTSNGSPNGGVLTDDSHLLTPVHHNLSSTTIHPVRSWDCADVKGEFLCSSCNRTFPQKALLIKHRIMHEEPKHTCETCGRCFVREDKLKRHIMSIHTTEKPHICSICGKAFSRKDKLKDHLKHHERAARNFECQQCQQRFVQKSDLNRHIRGVHQGEPGVGINMGTKRRAPGVTPIRLNKKKSKSASLNSSVGSAFSVVASTSDTTNPHTDPTNRIDLKTQNGGCVVGSYVNRKALVGDGESAPVTPSSSCSSSSPLVNNSSTSIPTVTSVTAAVASLAAMPNMTPAPHSVFAAGAASGLMLPTMTFSQAAAAQQQLVQQHQAAAAAAAVMLPGGATMTTMGTATHHSALALHHHQQQQQQFFAINALPNNSLTQSAAVVAQAQHQQHALQHTAQNAATQQQIHLQPELKTVATPSGPMMVLTRIAAASQAGQVHQLASQAMFPQMVGFHSASTQQQQLQQLQQQQQQQAAVAQHHQQLLQQQQASYAAAAAAAGTQLVAVSNQQTGQHLNMNGNIQAGTTHAAAAAAATAAHQFHLHQQANQQLQQQQQAAAAAALAARQHAAAHGFLFPSTASATAAPAGFFCHPQDGSMAAGLILASSADPTGFALAAAAQAQAAAAAAAAAAQQQATTVCTTSSNLNGSTLSASALAAATGLQVVAGYPDVAQHYAQQQQQQQQQQLLFQQQQQQRLVAAAANATNVFMTSGSGNGSGTSLIGPNSASVFLNSSQEDPLRQQPTTQVMMSAQPDSATAMNSCYQLAAALYQQHHPGLVLAAANNAAAAAAAVAGAHNSNSVANTGSAVTTMTLQHHHHQDQQQQQQQYQQQVQHQAGLMAAYHHHHQQQQQQAAHHQQQQHALQQAQQQASQ